MEHSSPAVGPMASPLAGTAQTPAARARLRVVSARFPLAQPPEPTPEDWSAGLMQLLGWLGIEAELLPAAPARRLPRMADWAMGQNALAPSPAPIFAPWHGWAPSAFQHGGLPGLPAAQFVASYLVDHARGSGAASPGGLDVMLMSPHPAQCTAEEAGEVPLPRAGALKAMIRAARAEGRVRLAIMLHARQRNGLARLLLTAERAQTRPGDQGGLGIEILTVEDALPLLTAGARRWDAIIAMPDLRSTVFTLLSHASGTARAWPLAWFGRGLQRVTCEVPGEGQSRLALDAPALIHALTLTLHHAGCTRAALRLHEGWSRLRDSGVTSSGRLAEAPYVTSVSDADFLAMLCAGTAVSKRPAHVWRAITAAPDAPCANPAASLRLVASHSPHSQS